METGTNDKLAGAKKLLETFVAGHTNFIMADEIARRYYANQNDILYAKKKDKKDEEKPELRNADNRIPSAFHSLLVDQKAGYMFSSPPSFDVGTDEQNKQVTEVLGDTYEKNAKELCVNASNAGIAWLHYWVDDAEFKWGVVPSAQIIPIWGTTLEHNLQAAVRCYEELDVETGEAYNVFEIWDDTICRAFRKKKSLSINEGLNPYDMFSIFMEKNQSEAANEFVHDLGEVPFIPFKNNGNCYSDLDRIKRLIDAYDKTYSGFINDLEDIQEIIFVLTNYGGQNLNEFIRDLKYYKTIQVDSIGSEDKSGVSTLTIDIPVEAREKALEITRKSIFTMGQGIDPEMQGLDGTSGEAMKFLYALLELKAGLMETEFRLSFNQFIRAICRFKGITPHNIIQTWTRTMIRNDAELVDMCSKSKGIISDKTILKAHPFVEDVEAEEEQLAKEKEAELSSYEFNSTGGEEDGNA